MAASGAASVGWRRQRGGRRSRGSASASRAEHYGVSSDSVLVVLDSNHTHQHVLAELTAYAPLTSVGSYCVVFDTIIDELPADAFPDRPWGPGNNPRTAVSEYLASHPEFEIDDGIDDRLLISVAPGGYLKRIR